MIEGAEGLLRVLRYTPVATDQDYVRAAAHEDINLITILPAATAPGLQVKMQQVSGTMCLSSRIHWLLILAICFKRRPGSFTRRPPIVW